MIMKKETKPSPFEGFTECVEKVQAFRFEDAHQINNVLDAFGADYDTWKIESNKGKLTLSFPKPSVVEAVPATIDSATMTQTVTTYTLTVPANYTYTVDSGWMKVHEGDWIVRRYIGSQHEETVVMTDQDFKRRFR